MEQESSNPFQALIQKLTGITNNSGYAVSFWQFLGQKNRVLGAKLVKELTLKLVSN